MRETLLGSFFFVAEETISNNNSEIIQNLQHSLIYSTFIDFCHCNPNLTTIILTLLTTSKSAWRDRSKRPEILQKSHST